MIILSVFRAIRDVIEDSMALRDQVMARYPHLRHDV